MPKMRIGFDEIQPQQVSYEDGISSIDTVRGGEYEDQIGISDGFLPPETQTRGCCAYCSSRTNMDFHQAGCNINFIQCRVYHSWKSHNFLQHQISKLSNNMQWWMPNWVSKGPAIGKSSSIRFQPSSYLKQIFLVWKTVVCFFCITAVLLLNQDNMKITLVSPIFF